MIKCSLALTSLAALALSAGCAANPLIVKKFEAGIDRLTYEEVLAEMAPHWGKPVSEFEIQGRDLLQVNYGQLESRNVERTVYHPKEVSSHATSETVKVTEITHGESYMFIIARSTRLLKWFQYRKFVDGSLTSKGDGGEASNGPRTGDVYLPKEEAKVTLPAASSPLEQKLGTLKDLRDKKVISGEEYERLRQKVLDDFK